MDIEELDRLEHERWLLNQRHEMNRTIAHLKKGNEGLPEPRRLKRKKRPLKR